MLAALLLLATLDPWQLPPPSGFADCEQRIAEYPREFGAWFCYQQMAYRQPKAEWEEKTAKELHERLVKHPHDPFTLLMIGLIDTSEFDHLPLYREAAAALHAQGIFEGEVVTRTSMATDQCEAGQFADADQEIALAMTAAQATGVPSLLAQAEIFGANCARAQADYGRSFALYRSARERLLNSPPDWRTKWLLGNTFDGLGQLYSLTGRHQEALEILLSELDTRDPFMRSCAEYRVAEEATRLARQGGMSWEEADGYLKQALDDEVKFGCRAYINGGEIFTRLLLAERLGATDAGIKEAEHALEETRRDGLPIRVCRAQRLIATLLIEHDKNALNPALEAVEEAIAAATKYGSGSELAQGLMTRAHVRVRGGEREEGLKDALAALEAFDRLREMQPDEMVRARTATEWSSAYHYVAGLLLEDHAAPEQAFATMERMRARSLLELLDQAPDSATAPQRRERASLLNEISQVQRALLLPALAEADRERDLAQLQELESREESLRDQIARASATTNKLEAPPTLAQVQEQLGPDEAMLLFQLFDREGAESTYLQGSSWVLAVARDRVLAIPLPDSSRLGGEVDLLSGLVARRDESDRPGAQVLYKELLGEALAALGPAVTRLAIVPDGPLHRLPFEALRDPAGRTLAESRELTIAPSAALWLHWRRAPATRAQIPALALGDPSLGIESPPGTPNDRRWTLGRRPGPLPAAREEARAVVRVLGRGSELRVGSDATEQFLKTTDLRRFGVLHIAAHALVDEVRPERSAILLAPGAPGEDGLLQMREIGALDLRGDVVVLATCDGSSGELLEGEGTMSLARGFFQAGARAVIGSLWPLRDDEAALFFDPFYRRLGEGASVSDAMAFARRVRIAAGAPAAAWAGLIVLGDGSTAPISRAASSWFSPRSLAAFAAAAILLGGAALWFTRKRRAAS